MMLLSRHPARRPAGAERAGAGGGPGRRGLFRLANVREAKRRAALRLMAKEVQMEPGGISLTMAMKVLRLGSAP